MTVDLNKTENNEPQQQNQVQVAPETAADPSPEIKSESNKENWRRFREEREQERKARAEAEKIAEQKKAEADALKAAMESLLNRPQPTQFQEPSQYQETDESIIEKKVAAALEKERQRVQLEQQQQEKQSLPTKLESTYRDFNKVCSSENLDYFEYHFPELAAPYRYMPDGFDKWSAIYQAVKKFVPDGHKEDQKRMQENAAKPKTTAPSLMDTKPQGQPWILTEERKRANWERMQKERKNIA